MPNIKVKAHVFLTIFFTSGGMVGILHIKPLCGYVTFHSFKATSLTNIRISFII